MKSVSSPKILNIVLAIAILLLFVLVVWTGDKGKPLAKEKLISDALNTPMELTYNKLGFVSYIINEQVIVEVKDQDYYIKQQAETIRFFCRLFDYQYDDIISDLKSKETEDEVFEATNIGYLKDKAGNINTYPNFEYGLIEYFYNLNNSNSKLRKVKYVPYTGDAKYVENLIIYFSSIYPNVDAKALLSIGAAESGYYKVKYMLKYNNVYGGMSSKGLIKHNNIEQGVLSFVRLMSKNYYGKGLTTFEAIGRVYCPVNDNGVKKASAHWLSLVKNAKNKYDSYPSTITFNELIKKEAI